MFELIMDKLIERGYSKGSTSKMSEVIIDADWCEIKDILNNLDESEIE